MRAHTAVAAVQENGCWALANIAVYSKDNPKMHRLVREAGAVALADQAIANHGKVHPRVKQQADRLKTNVAKRGVSGMLGL